jgi:drug/metabolite transporter (DMT)-like permease
VAACLVSAACFGALPILGKQAYQAGTGPLGLLWARFGLAAILFWVLVGVVVRPSRPATRFLAAGLLMGFCGYALEAALFFLALERIDASLTELLLYAYPVIVAVGALALGRESPSPRLVCALSLASAGLLLVSAGSLASGVDPVGLALGIGSAAVYAGYVLTGERVVAVVHPALLAALICTGAAAAFTVTGLARGPLPVPATSAAWAWVGLIAVVATVVPMVALFASIDRVGATTASIVSTFEPVVTVVLAALFLGEHLSAVEALGAASVLAAVRLLQTPGQATEPPRRPPTKPEPEAVDVSRPPLERAPALTRR